MTLRLVLVSCLLMLSLPATAGADADAQLMLLGLFHFANPKQDVVKTEQIDVTTAENQRYLEGLTDRLAGFRPTAVLLEFDPADQAAMQARYERYLAGESELPVNEVYQLGFRIARKAGLTTIHSFDERDVGWNAGPLFARLESGEPAMKARLDAEIGKITEEMNQAHAKLGLAELLAWHNQPEQDQRNMAFYLMTNGVGAGEDFVGADAAASWWQRNFRMYARIQQHATPGARVIAIGGQGHTAILKQLAAIDPDVELVAVDGYLTPPR